MQTRWPRWVLFLLLILWPFMLLVAVMILIRDGRPVLYVSERMKKTGINLGGVRRERKETEIKQDQQAAHGLPGFRACERGVDWLDGGADERRREDAGRQIRFRGRG